MIIKRYSAFLLALAVSVFSMSAQTASFLNVPDDAKDLGMGGVSFVRDAECVLDDTSLTADVSYFRWSPKGVGSNLIDVDVNYSFGRIGVFGEVRMNGYASYPMFDGSGNGTGEYKPNEMMAGVGAAYAITDGLAVSVLAKYVGSKLAPEANANAFCADVNLVYRHDALTAGLLAANLGSGLNYGSSKVALPMMVKAGAAYDLGFGDDFDLQLGLDAGYMAQSGHNAVVASAGADLKMFDIASVRAGYHFSSNTAFDPSYISAGLGVDVSVISISAAYLFGPSPMSGTLCAAIGVRF